MQEFFACEYKSLCGVRLPCIDRQHRALYDALCSRDVDAAVHVITAHLEKARRDLLGVDTR